MDDLTVRPPLTVVPSQSPPVQRMPPIADDHIVPDMGRMTQ